MLQGTGGVEAGGRHATVPGGRGEPERGGPQQAQGPAGVGDPAGEQTHQDSPAREQGAEGGSGGTPGRTDLKVSGLFWLVESQCLERAGADHVQVPAARHQAGQLSQAGLSGTEQQKYPGEVSVLVSCDHQTSLHHFTVIFSSDAGREDREGL